MSAFPPATDAAWRAKVLKVLKGEDLEERLVSHVDGLRIEPLYGATDGTPVSRGTGESWRIFQRMDHPDPEKAAAQALDDLDNGATGLILVQKNHSASRGFGLLPDNIAGALRPIPLHKAQVRIEGSDDLAKAFAAHVASQPLDPSLLPVNFSLNVTAQAKSLHAQGFRGPFAGADGRLFHEQGLTDAEELGATLATAVSLLRSLEWLDDAQLAASVGVTLAATQDMFLTLAKFRAMRLLWARFLELCGLPASVLNLHGETAWRMMAMRDPHANMLRAVTAVFGAGLGGASSICVLPLSAAQGLPNAFARRMARNTQIILQQESHLWRPDDPAAGSGYIETLTDRLCEEAWDAFRNCERGIWPKPDQTNTRALPVIGDTAYPLTAEHAAEIEAAP